MKKKMIISSIVFSLMMLFGNQVQAQKFSSLNKSPMDAASYPSAYNESNKLVKVVYSRPQLKGRSIAKLTNSGEIWRFGANEAAEITFYTEMKLDGKTIKAGSYSIAAITGDTEWTIIVNTSLNGWGSSAFKDGTDVARITVPATMASESIEAFSIAFEESDNGANMHLGWGTVRVAVPFTK
ncbi:MAG: hypothetical protein ACI9M9_000188 [Flavobacteriaceae bacterium]|jgi:hypothetical protein